MTLSSLAQGHPRLFNHCIHVDRAPAIGWLALQAAALTPVWWWMARRLQDGSDDPLGLLALAALALLVWARRHELRCAPRLGCLALAALGTVAATLLRTGIGPLAPWPPLASALVAVLALAAGLLALLPRRVAAAPVLGLAVLALPLPSSLQFYLGFPLRVQMAWFGYFTACAVALWAERGSRSFLARLPLVGLVVLAGNIARNSLLVGFEGAGMHLAPWLHEAIGLAMLAVVCGAVGWLMQASRSTGSAQ